MATGAIPPEAGEEQVLARIGGRLATARRRDRATLADVAERSGLSPAYVNQVETGSANPTMRALARIAAALDVELEAALGGGGAVPDTAFAPYFARRPRLTDASGAVGVWDRSAEGARTLQARIVHGGAGDHAEPVSHSGEEFVVVLAGRCRLHVGDDVRDLDAGDTCHLAAAGPHHLSDVSPDLTLAVVLGAPAT